MRKKPVHYSGCDIENNVIKKIKDISRQRYDEIIYENYYSDIDTLYELCCLHDTSFDEENIILGEDWFISYANRIKNIEITEWVALEDSKNKMAQVKEMLVAIKKIITSSERKRISAFMRRDTSYQFYLTYLNKGYFKEIGNSIVLDFCRPEEMKHAYANIKKHYGSYEVYFADKDRYNYPHYDKFVLHNVTFEVNKDFMKMVKK